METSFDRRSVLDPLPRTPHVFEEQLKRPLENSPWEASLAWVPNYGSVEDHKEFARAKFEEDVEEDLRAKMWGSSWSATGSSVRSRR